MKTPLPSTLFGFSAMPLVAVLLVAAGGCGKKSGSAPRPAPPTTSLPTATAAASAAIEQVLASWHQGDQASSVQQFLETDWKTKPAFGPGSPLSHHESDLAGMSATDRDSLLKEVSAQLSDLKALARAVREKGQAAASTDPELARRCFTRLDEFGAVLDQPDRLKLVQLVGQAFRKLAAAETAKLGR